MKIWPSFSSYFSQNTLRLSDSRGSNNLHSIFRLRALLYSTTTKEEHQFRSAHRPFLQDNGHHPTLIAVTFQVFSDTLARQASWGETSLQITIAKYIGIFQTELHPGPERRLLFPDPVLYSAPRGFSQDTPVFPSPQKPTFTNSNSILECTGISERVL